MTSAVAKLERLGFELIPEPPEHIRVRWPSGPEPDEAPPLIEELRQNKATVLEELSTWNEHRAKQRQRHAFDWADQVTPPGCWAWLLANGYRRLQDELDITFDEVNQAFAHRDVEALSQALSRFRHVVEQAVSAYKIATEPQEVVQTPNAE